MQHERLSSLASTSSRCPALPQRRSGLRCQLLHCTPSTRRHLAPNPAATRREGGPLEKVEAFSATASGADLELDISELMSAASASRDAAQLEQTLEVGPIAITLEPEVEALEASVPLIAQEVELQEKLHTLQVLTVAEKRYEALFGWVGAAVAFGGGIWYFEGTAKAQEYFAGYLLEQSLSVDNLFVFVLVFGYFKTPPAMQQKVLKYGIITAGVLRAVMILLGIELITSFRPFLAVFAGILIFSSYKLLTSGGEDGDGEDEGDLSGNFLVTLCTKYIKVSDSYDGDKFFTTAADGARLATPLLLVLGVVELSDVVFAVDSIPAVFGVTLDPFIVYSSNIFAILSLRSLYAFVSTILSELRYLDKAVAVVLGFIGTKMLVSFADIEIPTDVSLLVVGSLLGGGVAASLLLPADAAAPTEPKDKELK